MKTEKKYLSSKCRSCLFTHTLYIRCNCSRVSPSESPEVVWLWRIGSTALPACPHWPGRSFLAYFSLSRTQWYWGELMEREEQSWPVAVGLSTSSMVPSTMPTLPCDGTACETLMSGKKRWLWPSIDDHRTLGFPPKHEQQTLLYQTHVKLRMGLQVFFNSGFHPFGPVLYYLVSSPSRYLQVDQASIHLCLHTFRRLSFLHFSIWDVFQALSPPFACFPLSLHCFFRIDIKTWCSICAALLQVLYAEVIPLTFWDCSQDLPVGDHACPTLPGICVWHNTSSQNTSLLSWGSLLYVKMLVI